MLFIVESGERIVVRSLGKNRDGTDISLFNVCTGNVREGLRTIMKQVRISGLLPRIGSGASHIRSTNANNHTTMFRKKRA
jgi:hypothetical protein